MVKTPKWVMRCASLVDVESGFKASISKIWYFCDLAPLQMLSVIHSYSTVENDPSLGLWYMCICLQANPMLC